MGSASLGAADCWLKVLSAKDCAMLWSLLGFEDGLGMHSLLCEQEKWEWDIKLEIENCVKILCS